MNPLLTPRISNITAEANYFSTISRPTLDNFVPELSWIAKYWPDTSTERVLFDAQRFEEARTLWEAAANRGESRAQYAMGVIWDEGLGVERDPRLAKEWYRLASEGRIPEASNGIGVMFEAGDGVPVDLNNAFAWYERAAKGGDSLGMCNLGSMYERGRGCVIDLEKAGRCYHQAAQLGNGGAAFNLGMIFDFRLKDDRGASLWYAIAFQLGRFDALANFQALRLAGRIPRDLYPVLGLEPAAGETSNNLPSDRSTVKMIRAAAGMSTVNLNSGQAGKSYSSYVGTPDFLLKELSTWFAEAISVMGDPVPFPASFLSALMEVTTGEEMADEAKRFEMPTRHYSGFSGVVFNVDDSLNIIVLNPWQKAITTLAFSDHPHPKLWKSMMDRMPDVTLCGEPAAPWGARVSHPPGSIFFEGAWKWLFPMEVAFANLFMLMGEVKKGHRW